MSAGMRRTYHREAAEGIGRDALRELARAEGKLAHLKALCRDAYADGSNALLALQVEAIIDDPEGYGPGEADPQRGPNGGLTLEQGTPMEVGPAEPAPGRIVQRWLAATMDLLTLPSGPALFRETARQVERDSKPVNPLPFEEDRWARTEERRMLFGPSLGAGPAESEPGSFEDQARPVLAVYGDDKIPLYEALARLKAIHESTGSVDPKPERSNRERGYAAAWEFVRSLPKLPGNETAYRNAPIWRAVQAYADAAERPGPAEPESRA